MVRKHCWMTAYLVSLILLGTIVLLFMVSTAHSSQYKSNFDKIPAINDQPIRVAKWKRTPTVIVCDSAPIEKSQVAKAIKIWKDLGHYFFTTQYKRDPLNKCLQPNPMGYILIQLVDQKVLLGEESLAVTHFYVNNDTNEVDWAIIYLKNDIRDTVLEHELGHALGFLHFDKINHLMNSKWTQGGWDTDGLESPQP